MLPLRHATPLRGIVWQHVPLDDRNGPVEVGEHPSGEQPAHACSKHNGALADLAHRHLLFVGDRDQSGIEHAAGAAAESGDGHGGLLGSQRVDYALWWAEDHRSECVNARGQGS
jgi:hypothetical protein